MTDFWKLVLEKLTQKLIIQIRPAIVQSQFLLELYLFNNSCPNFNTQLFVLLEHEHGMKFHGMHKQKTFTTIKL